MSTYPTDLADRFATMRPDPVASDWLDVQRRARASRKRHLVAYALAAAFAIVLVGCTAAFGPRIVSFADSKPSPPHVLDELTVNRAAYEDIYAAFPGFDENETRRVVDRRFAGGTIAIDLTPLKGGGFCYVIDRVGKNGIGSGRDSGECVTSGRMRSEKMGVREQDTVGIASGVLGNRKGGMTALLGWVAAPGFDDLRVAYEDGTTASLEYFRVTKPIDTAFFLFDVPEGNESYPRRAAELRALDGDGNVIARVSTLPTAPDEWTFPRWGKFRFPPAADTSRVRKLVFPRTGARIWLAPAKGDATCFIFRLGEGSDQRSGSESCLLDADWRHIFRLDENSFWLFGQDSDGQPTPLFWGIVEPQVRRVELLFQDGARDTTAPQEGFVLYPVPVRHHAAGTRLVNALLRDAKGRVVRGIAFDPTIRDRYPCDNPRSDTEYGPEHCP